MSNALFELEAFHGAIVSDLFGDERYFADADTFWPLQTKAVAEQREAFLADGWGEVIVLDIGQRFATWEHRKTPKKKGGKIFIAVTQDGEVTVHEGWLPEKEARRRDKAEAANAGAEESTASQPERNELTKAMQNYLGLHKHAAVRVELLSRPSIALRLTVAHMMAGSGLWSVKPEPQRTENEAIAASLANAKATSSFGEERSAIGMLLGLGEDEASVARQGHGDSRNLVGLFQTLIGMDDEMVLRILALVIAETLEAHTPLVEHLGGLLVTDMAGWWAPDQAFFDLVRGKQALNGMLREVAGDVTADAHLASTAKVQKKIIADCLTGESRTKVEGWLPRWMTFALASDLTPTSDLPDENNEALTADDSVIAEAA